MFQHLVSDKLLGKKCKSCGNTFVLPASVCANCGSKDFEDYTFSKLGTIYTFTVVHVGFGHMAKRVPYVLAIVEMDQEKSRLLTILETSNNLETIAIGQKVSWKKTDEQLGPIFDLVG